MKVQIPLQLFSAAGLSKATRLLTTSLTASLILISPSCSTPRVQPDFPRDDLAKDMPPETMSSIELLYSGALPEQLQAVKSLADNPKRSEGAIPVLVSLIGWNDQLNEAVFATLTRMGDTAIRQLAGALVLVPSSELDAADLIIARAQGYPPRRGGAIPPDRRFIVGVRNPWIAERTKDDLGNALSRFGTRAQPILEALIADLRKQQADNGAAAQSPTSLQTIGIQRLEFVLTVIRQGNKPRWW